MRSHLRSAALIEAWFDSLSPVQRDAARRLRDAVLGAGPVLDEAVKWGNLVFSVNRVHAVAIAPYREQLHLQVFNGAAVQARHPQLVGGRGHLRHLRVALGGPPDTESVRALVRDSVAAIVEAGATAGPPRDQNE